MNAVGFLLLLVLAPALVICYEGMKVGELPPETAAELKEIYGIEQLQANCTNHPKPSPPKYYLFNRANSEHPVELTQSNKNQIESEKKTIVVIPGWLTYINNSIIMQLKDAYLTRYDCNLIVVDWSKYAFESYTSVFCSVKTHAINVADFLCGLDWESNILLESVHVIGHSFGAQIAGFSGKYTDLECDRKIGRITGLDPAGPLYNYESNDEKLSLEDALFVDIIHTDFDLGATRTSGHLDFHPHCSLDQPGCDQVVRVTDDMQISECFCSSVRSIELMAESVNSNQLIGVSCSRCSIYCEPDIITEVYEMMGEDARKPINKGADNFLIYTGDRSPYGLGMLPYPRA